MKSSLIVRKQVHKFDSYFHKFNLVSCEKTIETNEGIGSQDGILEIIIYRTDRLKVVSSTCHLFVRVHIMDTETEDYIKCDKK